MELYSQLQLSVDLGYISEDDFNQIRPLFFTTSKLLNGLHKAKQNQS